ncbi:MAG TPA: nuclear transport factor 2 family protein [Pyrinomonadaceae bacterium]|nr:nuclear transport factor 2 family protein [Pyrinomonadaceae bacterium]
MKRILSILAALMAVAFTLACEPGSTGNTTAVSNANAVNSNANTAPTSAAPTASELMAIERKAWDDWASRNATGLEGYMAPNFVNVGYNGASDRVAAMKSWTSHKCEMKDMAFSDEAVTQFADDLALLTFKATGAITCDGIVGPDPVNVSVIYAREGGTWKAMYYHEVPTADAKGEYGPPSATYDKSAELASLKPAPEDLVAAETKLWDTWKAQDQKGFEEHLADEIVVNGPQGRLDRAQQLKYAFGSECKVESINLGPMKSMELSEGVTMIFYRTAVKGTCGTETVPPNSMAATIYKRENGTPKAIYFMESPVRN